MRISDWSSDVCSSDLLTLRCGVEVAFYVLNRKRDDIVALEARYGVGIEVIPDDEMHSPQYAIEAGGPPPDRTLDIRPTAPPAPVEEEDEEGFLEGDLADGKAEDEGAEGTEKAP